MIIVFSPYMCMCEKKYRVYNRYTNTNTHTHKQIMGCIAYHETMAELGAIAVCGD